MPADELPLVQSPARNLRLWISIAVVVAALALQVYLPLYLDLIGNLDLPLLVVIYLALLQRNVIAGLLIGALIGLAQDSLTQGPIGVFGILKTVIGYLAGSVSLVVEVDYPGARSVLVALFFLAHQILFWIVERTLLGNEIVIDPVRILILATAHAGLALLLFQFLDRFRKSQ